MSDNEKAAALRHNVDVAYVQGRTAILLECHAAEGIANDLDALTEARKELDDETALRAIVTKMPALEAELAGLRKLVDELIAWDSTYPKGRYYNEHDFRGHEHELDSICERARRLRDPAKGEKL